MHLRPRLVYNFALVLIAAAIGLAPPPAHADIALAPGDVIALKVIGIDELAHEAIIDTDGTINLPLVGRIPAADRSVESIRDDVFAALSLKAIRLDNSNESSWLKLDASRIHVAVAEYRPVYVMGSVRNPGARPYRPGMTARQAFALAGGVGQMVDDQAGALEEIARISSDRQYYADLRAQAATEVNRYLAELEALNEPGDAGSAETPPAELSASDESWLSARAELRELNQRTTDQSLEQMYERLNVLGQLEEVNDATLQTYEDEYTRLARLAERGIATSNAVSEAQRGVLAVSSRALETAAERANLQVAIAREADKPEAERTLGRVETLERVLSALGKVKEYEARIRSSDTRLSFLAQAGYDVPNLSLQVVIHRGEGAEVREIPAELDALVFPGDVLFFAQVDQGALTE